MSITATFTANFTSFNAAVQQADAKLKDFGEGADKVGGKLSRFANEFSGRRLIQEATVMAEAIERIGGTSKLTEAELAKVGAKAQEAATKMKLLGMEVPAGIQKIADQTQSLTSKQTALIGSLTKVAAAFGLAFSAQALVGFVKSVFAAADAIKTTALAWGVSTEAAQKFSQAAKLSGATAEDVGGAFQTMNREIGEGSAKYKSLVTELGLSFETLRRSNPEAAFRAIATAVAGIEDPMLQADYATQLFGRGAAALLPALRSGFLELADAQKVAADATIQRIAAAQEAWDNFYNSLMVRSMEVLSTTLAEVDELTGGWERAAAYLARLVYAGPQAAAAWAQQQSYIRAAAKAAEEDTARIQKALAKTGGPAAPKPRSTADVAADTKAAEDAARKAAAAQAAWNEQLRAFRNLVGLRQMEDARAAMDAQAKQIEVNVELEFELGKMYQQNAAALGAYAGNVGLYTQQWAGYMALAPGITQNITNNGKALAEIPWTDDLDRLERVLSGIQTEFAQMAVAGVRAMKEIDKAWNDTTLSKGQKTSATIVAGLGAAASMTEGTRAGGVLSGAASGAAIGSMFGPWGTAIGAGVGAIAGFVKGRKIERELNAQKQALIDSAGGWHALNSAAAKAGVTLEKVLNAKTVQAYEAAVRELQGAIEFQDQSMATLNETAQRYGFTLEELGPAMQRQELDKQAQQLFKDWEVLNAAGIDTVAITSRMSEAINAYLAQAMALGTEVPAAMKPMLEEMVRMGQLTDASGNRIDSLEDAGISFAMTMSEGFKALIDEVGKLTQAIARGLGVALDSTTDKIVKMPKTIPVDIVYNDHGYQSPAIQMPGELVPGFATGTGGKYLNFGAGTLAMLHGREKITPAGASEGGGDVSELRAEVQGLRADLARQSRLLPKQLRDALLLAS